MKKMFAFLTAVSLFAGSSIVLAADAATGQVIGVVNVQQIFQQSPKIADLNKKLQNQFKSRQEKLVTAQKKLQKEVDQFKTEGPTMTAKNKDKLQQKIVDDQASFSKDATAFQQDLSTEQNKIMKNVLAQLNEIISSLAKKNHYNLVLDSQAVVFASDGVDITKQVSKEFG